MHNRVSFQVPLFDVAVTNEFTDDLCSVIALSLSSTGVYMEN